MPHMARSKKPISVFPRIWQQDVEKYLSSFWHIKKIEHFQGAKILHLWEKNENVPQMAQFQNYKIPD